MVIVLTTWKTNKSILLFINILMQVINNIEIPSWITNLINSANITQTSVANFFDPVKPQLDSWVSQLLGSKIKSTQNWLNYMLPNLPGECTYYRWHNESGYDQDAVEGTHAATIWFSGDEDCGGEFQWLDDEGMLYQMAFKPQTIFIIDTQVIHRVTDYYGTQPRSSATFCFDYAGC